MTFTDILVPTYTNLLGALSAWLGKAEALLVARLASKDTDPCSVCCTSCVAPVC